MQAPSSSAHSAVAGGSADLRVKLTWVTLFRTVATVLLTVAIAARLFAAPTGSPLTPADSASFALIALVFGLNLVHGFVLRRRTVGSAAVYLQVLGDVVVATSLVYLTGGVESPFTFTYSIAVLAASILLFQRGALVAAGASALAFSSLAVASQTGLLMPPQGSVAVAPGRLVFLLVSNALAQFLLAWLAGYLARQLSAAGGRLQAREAEFLTLTGLHQQIITAMPSGLLTCDAQGVISYSNPAAKAILGVASAPQRSLQLDELIPGATGLGAHVRRAELSVRTPAGQKVLGLTVTPLEGRVGEKLIVFQDLTELRRTEDELRRTDRLASLGKLSAQLAHEIRNPLASMRGSAQMLAQQVGTESSTQRLAGILMRESDRLTSLVEDILRFARPPPPTRQSVDLALLSAETMEVLRADPLAREVRLEQALRRAVVDADDGQVRQVLINLVRNALAAAGPGGKVRISVSPEPGGGVLSVWDSAGGIEPTDLDRVFEPFFSNRAGGTGLGLSTAHSIVSAHGGKITVRSSKTEGTEFAVHLPEKSVS